MARNDDPTGGEHPQPDEGGAITRYLRDEVADHAEWLPENLKITEKLMLGAATM